MLRYKVYIHAKVKIFVEKSYLCPLIGKDHEHEQHKTFDRPFKTEGIYRNIRLSDERE